MTRDPLRITRPDLRWDDHGPLRRAIDSGWLTNGPQVRLFEERLRERLGVEHVLAVSSGTAALHVALLACGVQPGDEVLVPDFTFPATVNVIEHVGARPILVDIDLATFNIDVAEAAARVTGRTRALLPVHQFGRPADLTALVGLAERHGLVLIEDAACALGAAHEGRACGTVGRAGCFSFHPRKVVTTGEGGAIVTRDAVVAEACRQLRNHGLAADGGEDYRLCGYNYRLSDLHAAAGLGQLARLDALLERRAWLARRYSSRLAGLDGLLAPAADGAGPQTRPAQQSYVVLLDERVERAALIRRLCEAGIEAVVPARAVHTLPYYKTKYGFTDGMRPRSFRAAASTLALPLFAAMSEDDVDYVAETLRRALAAG